MITIRAVGLASSALALFFSCCFVSIASAANVPPGFTDSIVVTGISTPTAMELAPDGRIFVAQQTGALRVIKNGALLATPFVTLSVNAVGERGLLGVTFDPNFTSNRYVYVYYTTATSPIHNRVSRFTASTTDGDVAAAGETVLLDLDNLSSASNHNGGALHFGADGKLYIAVGENALGSNAQTLSNLHGKILRINADGTIPTDNPFYTTAVANNRAIWALGLRNPFTFSFEAFSGRMFINDVGQTTWEEIDRGVAGANYGWPSSEGPLNCTNPGFTCPIYAYDHTGGNCAITGGAFYDPATPQFPSSYDGMYFFAEHCGNWIKFIDPDAPPGNNGATTFATGIAAPVDLRVGSDGTLYYLARSAGAVGRIQYTASQAPTITQQPANQTRPVGGTAVFSISATGSAPLLYQWQRNQTNVVGATTATLSISNVQSSDDGASFRCQVANDFGSVFSNAATLTVTSNTPPTGTITLPAEGARYNAGQTINLSGTATDGQDPSIPASAFTWKVDFHHDTHSHPFVQPFSGVTSTSFQIPTTGETAANVWYRITLTVQDSGGLTHTSYRDVLPNTTTLTLASNPSGLQLTLDGQPVTTPHSVVSVVGFQRSLGVVSPQSLAGTSYQFSSWSDGGAATHTIDTPSSPTTYTATYTPVPVTTGEGLTGSYFPRRDLTGTPITRVDATVNFDWDRSAPLEGIPADNFSVRWTGFVQPNTSETVRFYALADDGVRLWVNNVRLVNRWYNNAGEGSATLTLVGGEKYAIRMEYFERSRRARARLSWSSPSLAKQVIPKGNLYRE